MLTLAPEDDMLFGCPICRKRMKEIGLTVYKCEECNKVFEVNKDIRRCQCCGEFFLLPGVEGKYCSHFKQGRGGRLMCEVHHKWEQKRKKEEENGSRSYNGSLPGDALA